METEGRKLKIQNVEETAAPAAAEALGALGVVSKEQREAERAKQLELLDAKPAELLAAGKVVKLSQLVESKKNHRKDFGDLDELGDSIQRHGQLTAIDVVAINPDVYEIIAGARRFRAMKKAGIKEARVNVYAATPEQAAELRVIENLHRKDLKPIEEAENFEELEQLGYSRATIAKAAKKTIGWVHSRMLLLKLAAKPRALLSSGKLPESVAYHLARYPAEQQDRALKGMEEWKGGRRILHGAGEGYDYVGKWEADDVLCNARAAIAFLHEDFASSLKSTAFDQDDPTLNPDKGACGSCADNSENQPRLEGEEKPKHGMCFDMVCFKKKTDAAWKLAAAKAEEKGAEVLSVAESKSALNGIDYRSGSRYVKANSIFDHDPKKRTVAQLVAELPKDGEGADEKGKGGFKRPAEIVAADPETKKPIKLFERADVERAFAEHFKWGKKLVERDSGATKSPEAAKREQEKIARRCRVSLEVLRKVIDGMRSKTILGDVRAIAMRYVDQGLGYSLNQLVESQEEGDGLASLFGMKTRRELHTWVEKKAKQPELLALLYVIAMAHEYGTAFGGYSAEVKEAAARYKVDLAKLEKLDEAARAEKPAAEKKS